MFDTDHAEFGMLAECTEESLSPQLDNRVCGIQVLARKICFWCYPQVGG